jgi:hypothetical protein
MQTLTTFTRAVWACAGAFCAASAAAASVVAPLRAEGTEWMLQLDPGAQLRSAAMVGAELRLAGGALLRIDGAQQVDGSAGHRFWAHDLSLQVQGQGWQPLCAAHSDGTRCAIVLPGRQHPDGSLAEDPFAFALSCTSGAMAKCLRLGYEPWPSATGSGHRLALFNACTRMMRADYTGLGASYTESGRRIDVYDTQGIQSADNLPGQAFEAGWNEHGAVCVHHVRVSEKTTLQALEDAAPHLRGKVGSICTEAHARAMGALLLNRSTPAPSASE